MSHGWQEGYCYVHHPIFQLWLLLLSVPVAKLRLEANTVMISIASEHIYNNRTDVLQFLALLPKVNKGDCLQIQTYRVYYSNKECYSEFYIKVL